MKSPTQSMPKIYPQALTLLLLSLLSFILAIPPLIWHIKSHNLTPSILVAWILLLNLFNILNASIWPNDATWSQFNGHVYCDIQSKLYIGSYVALTGCLVAIMRSLCQVMDTDNITLVPSKRQKIWDRIVNWSLCVGAPVLVMVLHYIVQNTRYYLFTVSGCVPGVDDSWLAILLVEVWPLVLSVLGAGYAVLLTLRIHHYKSRLSHLLQLSRTTKSRFLRLTIMSSTLILILLPIQIYIFYINISFGVTSYSWTQTHAEPYWSNTYITPSDGVVIFDRWIHVSAGFLVFLFFGLGADAVRMYGGWLRKIGINVDVGKFGGKEGSGESGKGKGFSFGMGSWGSFQERTRRLLGRSVAVGVGTTGVGSTGVTGTGIGTGAGTGVGTGTNTQSDKGGVLGKDSLSTSITVLSLKSFESGDWDLEAYKEVGR